MVPPAAATLPPFPSWTRVPALLWIIPRRRLCCQPRLRLEIRKTGVARIVDAWNTILEHDKDIRVLGEAKPNEPMDQAHLPTVGHMMAITHKTSDPDRSGVLIKSAHSILAGLDPADDMAFALYHGKLWSVHLND